MTARPSLGMRLFCSMIKDPTFSFSFYNKNKTMSEETGGKKWEIMQPQQDYMHTFHMLRHMVIASGRSVGKTSSIEHMIFTTAISNPDKHTGYVVKNQKHANVLIDHLSEYFNRTPFTRKMLLHIDKKDRKFYLNNGHSITIRIAGHDKTGATTMVSWHLDYLFIDEAQLLDYGLTFELYPAMQEGCRLVIAGVPNDLRGSILYRSCADKEFMYMRYATTEGADWDVLKEETLLKQYGSKQSQAWRNLVCFPANTDVFTKDGMKKISDIKIGDEVLTHKNRFKKVIGTNRRHYEGDMINIKQGYDYNAIICTPNHPIYNGNEFIEAYKYNIGDYIKFPEISPTKTLSYFGCELDVNNQITITNDLMFYLGVYVSEGTLDHLAPSTYSYNIMNILFRQISHGNIHTKRLTFEYYNLNDEHKIELLRGVFNNNGCLSISLHSKTLIYQIRLLLRTLNINCSIIKDGNKYKLKIYGFNTYKFYNLLYNENLTYTGSKHCVSYMDKGSKVVNTDIVSGFSGDVYNLMVANDSSYVVNDTVVHNCGLWGDSAENVFTPSKLVDNLRDVKIFRYKHYNGQRYDHIKRELNLPPVTLKYNKYILGGDMGYTSNSPLHICVLGAYDDVDPSDKSKTIEHYDVVYRLEIENMLSYDIAKTINHLLSYFNCKHAAIDAQTVGMQVYGELVNKEIFPTTFVRNKQYMLPVIFTKPVIMGKIESVDQVTNKPVVEDVAYAMKVAGTFKLQDLVDTGRFHIALEDARTDDYEDLVSILEAETQTPKINKLHPMIYNNMVNDHCVDALRCAALVIYMVIENGMYGFQNQQTLAQPKRLKNTVFNKRGVNSKFFKRRR